jgi:TolB-like protein/Tfp pilus assembly protein PilF
MSLIAELRRRNVFRVGAAYAIVGWLLVEVASVVLPTFKAPEWVMQVFTFLVILGFPLALALAWAFELTPEGMKRTRDVPVAESIRRAAGRKLDFLVIGLLLVALVVVVLDSYVLDAPGPASADRRVEESARAAASSIRSLAVLPLDNLSGDPKQEYFSDGMTEALIGDLARIASLRVISRTSVMQYKANPKPLPEIAAELGVDAVIEGSVMRDGDRVRITVQLIDARSDYHLWADRFDRDLRDVLAMQSEVAQAVARKIEIELSPKEEALLANTQAVNPEAHEAYLKGQYEAAKITSDGFTKAIEHYRKALVADPAYAPAHAGLSNAYLMLGQPMRGLPYREAMLEAKSAALKALELDTSLSDAHTALATVTLMYDWDWEAADRGLRRAIELNPNSAGAHLFYGLFLSMMGRHEEAIAQGTHAVELDPLNPGARVGRAELYYYARDHERSIEDCQTLIEIDPTFQRAYEILGCNYFVLENYEQAIEAEQLAGYITADEAVSLRAAYANLGKEGYGRWYLERYEAERSKGYVNPSDFAWAYAVLGNLDAAFASLEEAFEMRAGDLAFLKVDPGWDLLRGDPRFDDLLRRMNFPGS